MMECAHGLGAILGLGKGGKTGVNSVFSAVIGALR
jgi:hypothetical protein